MFRGEAGTGGQAKEEGANICIKRQIYSERRRDLVPQAMTERRRDLVPQAMTPGSEGARDGAHICIKTHERKTHTVKRHTCARDIFKLAESRVKFHFFFDEGSGHVIVG